MTTPDATPKEQEFETCTFAELLETVPPGSIRRVMDLAYFQNGAWLHSRPELQLHCSSEICNGTRMFAWAEGPPFSASQEERYFVSYTCRNCGRDSRHYALFMGRDGPSTPDALVVKVGEWPPFGPPTPSRLITMIGPDRELFLRGRRAENQGLGIGAFSYYRRVVEEQRTRILDEIIKVAQKQGAGADVIDRLLAARNEQQFKNSVEAAAGAIPRSLLIHNHNPLTLLHTALSEGLHNRSDEECLELAASIRLVLAELSERIVEALREEDELKQAVSRLLNRTQRD
jgi:hypothetical protein